MSRGLPQSVKDDLDKCRSAAMAAVDAYNRTGPRFRTAQYLVMITIAWTALFHALFYRRGRRPWYRRKTAGVRYVKIDGEPKHWDLSECLKQYHGSNNSPERQNLEFLIGLRNKIEHRHLPELDAALYGECQAALLNLEELLTSEFGFRYALMDQLAVSLQFSQVVPSEKRKAVHALARGGAKTVTEYVERFRGKLPATVLNSMKYSFNVFLVPKVTNRKAMADAAVEFVKVDEANDGELQRLEKLNVLIKEKHIPIANIDMFRPSQVVEQLQDGVPYAVTMHTHTCAWRHYGVRPASNSLHPERTRSEYCVFDNVHQDYVYTKAWIGMLAKELSTPAGYNRVVGWAAIRE